MTVVDCHWAKLQFMVLQKYCSENSEISFWYIRNEIMKDQNDFWYFSDAIHPKSPPTTPLVILWYINTAVPKRNLVISKMGDSNVYHSFDFVEKLLGSFINHVFVGLFQYDFGPPKYALELRDHVKYMFSPCICTLHLMIKWCIHCNIKIWT